MKWGITKDIDKEKNKKKSRSELGWVYIRHFWRKCHQLLSTDDIVDKFFDFLKKNPYYDNEYDKWFDYTNNIAKKYFCGEVNIDELKLALDKLYQLHLKIYYKIKGKKD